MNFDKEIDRYNSNSLKYDFKKDKNKPDDVLPMWVADMDFKCCDEILDDLHKKLEHGILGYTKNDERYFSAINSWYERNFNINLKQDWLVVVPNVVFALATAVKIFTKEDDYVLINNPVYYPFTEVINDNKRNVISSDLILNNNHYEIDFIDLEKKIKEYKVKLYLLCSPHNPVGRVWTKNELDKIIDICKRNGVYIVSDEIHSDFVWVGEQTCLLKYEDYQNNIILCTSPSKTFNLAGLQVANIFIPNKDIKDKFQKEVWNTGYSLINVMGLVACQSAYEKGQDWLNELRKYLVQNINLVDSFLKDRLPKIRLIYPEGTYLLWLDFSNLKIKNDEISNLILNEAKLWLDDGTMFGRLGEYYYRMNIALSKDKLYNALLNLEKVFKKFN